MHSYPGEPIWDNSQPTLPGDVSPSALLPVRLPPGAGAQHKAQMERRARILTEARNLIAQRGLDGVTLRELAWRSGLSVQTIYNIVGSRRAVLNAAIGQYISASVRHADRFSHCPNVVLGIAEALWVNVATNPDYNTAATIACDGRDRELHQLVRKRSLRCVTALLSRNFREPAARGNVDLTALSENIVVLAGSAALEWAQRNLSLRDLRYRLASAYGLSVLPILPDGEAERVTSWLRALRA